MSNDAVPYGFRMAMKHLAMPPPRDAYERIVREAHERLNKLLKHTHVRISFLSAQDCERGRALLKRCKCEVPR